MNADQLLHLMIMAGLLFVACYCLLVMRLAQEGISRLVRNVSKSVLIMFLVSLILVSKTNLELGQQRGIAAIIGILSFVGFQKGKRSRYIPRDVRREVIARDLKGKPFDPEKHVLDHIWPHSKGGSNTVRNLRVIERDSNAKKGARRPRLRDMWPR